MLPSELEGGKNQSTGQKVSVEQQHWNQQEPRIDKFFPGALQQENKNPEDRRDYQRSSNDIEQTDIDLVIDNAQRIEEALQQVERCSSDSGV